VRIGGVDVWPIVEKFPHLQQVVWQKVDEMYFDSLIGERDGEME